MKRAMDLLILFALVAAATAQTQRYTPVDYQQLDRTIRKEPKYVAEPRYALFVFDLAGKHRVWAVADKTSKDAQYYDVLYLDLNGDGDLTQPGERFVGKFDEKMVPAGMGMTIRVGDIAVPGEDLVHTKFLVSTSPKAGRDGFWFRLYWGGREEVSGGYAALGTSSTTWQPAASKAPVFRPCPHGPLAFAIWNDAPLQLRAGQTAELNVIVGNAGGGPDTLAVVDEHFLDLGRDELTVTVIAKDSSGGEVRESTRIKKHC